MGGSRGTAGLRISWRSVGRRRFCGAFTSAQPPEAMDSWMASMIATSIRPSTPEGSGVPVGAHALGEMHELRRELIALREFLALLLLADREFVAEALGVFERRVAHDAALRADDLVARAVGGAEAADEIGDAVLAETS